MESDHKTDSDNFQAEMEQIKNKLSHLLPTLPKQEIGHPHRTIYQYQGFWYALTLLASLVSLHEDGDGRKSFRPLPTDTIIAGGPKSGNTWLKSLCFSIATRNQFPDIHSSSLLSHLSHDLVPFLEVDLAENPGGGGRDRRHPLLSTHLAYTALPESFRSSGCKFIYICREPKDVFVSRCHFVGKVTKNLYPTTTVIADASVTETSVDLFCEGKTMWGPYWDHVLSYYKASLDDPDKILFLKYEDLKRDTLFYVKKMADFMGFPFSGEEERRGLPEKIVEICSFGNLSGLEVNKTGKHYTVIDNSAYFRKAETGDWRNHLSPEMADKIDRVTSEKLKGYDFRFGSSN